jgi:hypothetical protein
LQRACPFLLHILPDPRQRYGAVLLLGAALGGLLARFLIDYLPRRLLRFRLVAELVGLSREGCRLFARPSRFGALTAFLRRHYGAYDRCLHADGGESRRRSLLLELGRDRTPGYPDLAGTRLARRLGVRELGFVVVLAGFGIPAEALAASLLVGLCMIVIGLPGCLLWLTGRDITRATAAKNGRVAAGVDP